MTQIEPNKTPGTPTKFRLDKHNAKLMGVCGGIANHFGWDSTLIRLSFVVGGLISFGTAAVLYIAIGLIAD